MSYQNDPAKRLYVALDYGSMDEALRLTDSLGDTVRSYKIGMQLYYKTGSVVIERLQQEGCDVFLDLKFHDIPATVAGAVQSVASLGVSMVNVHAAGGLEMMQRAKESAQITAREFGTNEPMVIAVTQLTSTTQQVMNEQLAIPGSVEDAVVHYAKLAQQAGLDGVVASAQEVEAIRAACGHEFVTVIPGIRPTWAAANDQKRILTPAEALRRGAHRLVIGRPISHAANPRDAASRILEEMGEALI